MTRAVAKGNFLKIEFKQEIINGNEYLDKEIYATAGGALQERVFVNI